MSESHNTALHARRYALIGKIRGLEWSYRLELHREKLIAMRSFQAELGNLNKALGIR